MADINANELTTRDNFTLQDKIVTGNSDTGEFTAPTDIKTFFQNVGIDIQEGYVGTASNAVSEDLSAQDSAMSDLFITDDGLGLYAVGNSNNLVYQYTLSTAFDITSTVFIRSFDPTTDDDDVRGITFNPDLTKMFLTGDENENIYEYTLSVAGDISTTGTAVTFNVSGQSTNPRGIAFNFDGSKLFMTSSAGTIVGHIEYELSTEYDLSTALYSGGNFSQSGSIPQDVEISNDGLILYTLIQSGTLVQAFELTEADDITTATTPFSTFSVGDQEATPNGFYINRQFDKLYVTGSTSNDVYGYSLSKLANNTTSGTFTPEISFGGGSTGIAYLANTGILPKIRRDDILLY